MSAEDGAEGDRPSREVAYRLFAAEFDDASFSYSESDEERAPNYVVTPTGARVNRLFAVGVLTEVEAVNDDVLRGRIVDPTGAFVSYAGQYQPDEMAFLDRASPPAFVALSGKARTFQPDDSDQVFTSVRPESMSRVDADTRDRWTVSTAEATLERIGVMAAALESGLRGETLRDALLAEGIDESLATGVPLALDHYSTTPTYLAALRQRAVEALEVVADERDSVQSLDVEPSSTEEPEPSLGELAAAIDLTGHAAAEGAGTDAETTETAAAETPATATEATEATEAETPASDAGQAADSDVASEPESEQTPATGEVPTFDEPGPTATESDAGESPADTDETETETEAEATSTSTSTESGATSEPSGDLGDFDDGPAGAEATSSARPNDTGGPTVEESGTPDAGDGGSSEVSDASEPAALDASDAPDGTDADGMYELDEEERAEVEAEFGTEFSTGSEVAPAGEADIDVPSVDELEDEFTEDDGGDGDAAETPAATTEETAAASTGTVETDETTVAAESGDDSAADATDATDATDTADATDATGADAAGEAVDLESAAVEAMAALDDGDGASREAVVARVVDEHGVDPAAVEDAIQSALMSGQCYEPTEDSLKAI